MKTERIKNILSGFLFITISIATYCQTQVVGVNNDNFKKHITKLCSAYMEGRETGTPGEFRSANYISSEFLKIGLESLTDNTYKQKYLYKNHTGRVDTGYNVIGYIDNQRNRTIIISSHYDHVGKNGIIVSDTGLHPGADDNASGIAMLIEIASSLASFPNLNNNYLFIAYSGHEQGIKGSKYFIRTKLAQLDKINYVLNFDILGDLDSIRPVLILKKSQLCTHFDSVIKNTPHPDFEIYTAMSAMDEIFEFSILNIPAMTFTTGPNKYHRSRNDTPDLINYTGLTEIHNYIFSLIMELEIRGKLINTQTSN